MNPERELLLPKVGMFLTSSQKLGSHNQTNKKHILRSSHNRILTVHNHKCLLHQAKPESKLKCPYNSNHVVNA